MRTTSEQLERLFEMLGGLSDLSPETLGFNDSTYNSLRGWSHHELTRLVEEVKDLEEYKLDRWSADREQ